MKMKVFGGMLCFLFVLSLNVKAQDSVRVALVQVPVITVGAAIILAHCLSF